jgi:phage recombination protein Bet
MKATCFKQRGDKQVTNEQMMALLVVAEQYGLNPFTKEIYAFPSDGGIVPIIGVDGWIRLINQRPEFKSMELRYAEDGDDNPWIECVINRKDRDAPTVVREYMEECRRDTTPWKTHPRRMLRHKAIIQAARVAFGFAGVFDPDEGDRVVAAQDAAANPLPKGKPKTEAPRARAAATVDDPSDGVVRITLDQATMIADKLKEEGVDLSLFLASFQIGAIEDLLIERYDAALKAIDQLSAEK